MALTPPPPAWATIKNKPNTVAGFGITDLAANAATSVNGQVGNVMVAAAGAGCTYTGGLVEAAGVHLYYIDGTQVVTPSSGGTVGLGANRVVCGLRVTAGSLPSDVYLYARGYNLKNN